MSFENLNKSENSRVTLAEAVLKINNSRHTLSKEGNQEEKIYELGALIQDLYSGKVSPKEAVKKVDQIVVNENSALK